MRRSDIQLLWIAVVTLWAFCSSSANAVVSKSSGRYQVVGTMGGESDGVAVIYDSESKKTRAFKKGDRISADLVLSSITRDQVLIKDVATEQLQALERKVASFSSEPPSPAPKTIEEDAEPVVTVIDAWGRQTEVTLEEYLSNDEEDADEYEVVESKKPEGLEQKYKSLFPSFLGTAGRSIPRLVNSKLKLPVIDPSSDRGINVGENLNEEDFESEAPSKEMLEFYRELEELDQAIEAGEYENE